MDVRKELDENTCYIKPHKELSGETIYIIMSSEGGTLTACNNRLTAFATASQHDLIPHSLH